jgi:hypothetical protein
LPATAFHTNGRHFGAAGGRARGVPLKSVMTVAMGNLGIVSLRDRPDLVRRRVTATQRSCPAALADPDAAVKALVKITDIPLNAELLKRSLQVFQSLATGTKPVGFTSEEAMRQTLDWLKQHGGVKTDEPATRFCTSEFVG